MIDTEEPLFRLPCLVVFKSFLLLLLKGKGAPALRAQYRPCTCRLMLWHSAPVK